MQLNLEVITLSEKANLKRSHVLCIYFDNDTQKRTKKKTVNPV